MSVTTSGSSYPVEYFRGCVRTASVVRPASDSPRNLGLPTIPSFAGSHRRAPVYTARPAIASAADSLHSRPPAHNTNLTDSGPAVRTAAVD
jgi:hypothetical protein